jgi:ferric-dicitrate binding protein FerR (iron transport regulator)
MCLFRLAPLFVTTLLFAACHGAETPAEAPAAPSGATGPTAAGVTAPTGATGATAATGATTPAPELPARRFLLIEGKVTVNGKAAKVGDAFAASVTLEVAKKGRAVVTLAPGTFVELRAGTKLTLGSSTRKTTSLKLLTGAIWSFVAKESSYEVETANAVAGVRGTVYYVEAKKTETYVCDCDGKLEVNAGGPASLPSNVESNKGHVGNSIKGKGKAAKLKAAKMHGHTEKEAKALLDLFEQAGGYRR